ncbi:MAG: RidA family protein [Thermomicrobiales bacterium]
MEKSYQNPEGAPKPIGPYSQVARVETGDTVFLYIAGQVAVDVEGKLVGAGDIEAQTDQVYKNIGAILAANGATFADVIKYTTYLVNIADRPASGAVRANYVSEPFPASTLVAVAALVQPEYLIEVEAVAVINR